LNELIRVKREDGASHVLAGTLSKNAKDSAFLR
jgi:hypothetical protein